MGKMVPPTSVMNDWPPENRELHNKVMAGKKVDGTRVIDGSGMSREEFINQTVANRDADVIKLQLMEERRRQFQENRGDLDFMNEQLYRKRMLDLDEKIASLQEDIAVNQQILNNTMEMPPPPPPPPSAPAQMFVNSGTNIKCSHAIPMPCTFQATPGRTVILEGTPMGNIGDFQPTVCIPPTGQCSSMLNPIVASATSAAMGVLTPQLCLPATVAPWIAGKPNVLVEGKPALLSTDMLMCTYSGTITFTPAPPAPPPVPGSGSGSSGKDPTKDVIKATQIIVNTELKKKAVNDLISKGMGKKAAGLKGQGALMLAQYGVAVVTGQASGYASSFDEMSNNVDKRMDELDDLFNHDAQYVVDNFGTVFRVGGENASDAITGAAGELNKLNQEASERKRERIREQWGDSLVGEALMLDSYLYDSAVDFVLTHGSGILGTFVRGVAGAMETGWNIGTSAVSSYKETMHNLEYNANFAGSVSFDDSDILGPNQKAYRR